MKNHERFKTRREAMTAFADEIIDTHPETNVMPQFVLDQWLLEWLYEDVKKEANK